ncbi:MAG: hypothetical protein PVJ67_05745 [Candidatus Pacearchaeota archaeon]|jgi:hypothetical protein
MKKWLLISFVFFLVLLPGIIAPHVDETDDEFYSVTSITLKAEGNELQWITEGYSKMGFKVVWSRNSSPTYPLRNGDKYHYYSSPSAHEDKLEAFDGEGTYYARVCEYLGGKCGIYSNEVEVYLKEGKKEEIKEDEKKTEGDSGIKEIDVCNQGCLLEQACYPLGYRKNGMYCSENLEFVNQSEDDSVCENNFECKTNLCVSGECLSEGLIRKILNWLKRWFG